MCKEKPEESYVHVSGKYYFSTDQNGYTVSKKSTIGKIGGKKTENYGKETYHVVGYTGAIKGVINLVIKELIHDKVATATLRNLNNVKEYFDKEVKLITDKFKI